MVGGFATPERWRNRTRWKPSVRLVASVLIVCCLSAAWPSRALAQPAAEPRAEGARSAQDDVGRPDKGVDPGTTAFDVLDVVGVIYVVGVSAGVVLGVWLIAKGVGRARTAGLTGGVLQVDPPIVAFGLVRVGETAVQQAVITNHGSVPMRLSATSVSGSGFTLEAAPSTQLIIAPGGRVDVRLRFRPSHPCRCSGILWIHTEAPKRDWRVEVEARAVNMPTSLPSQGTVPVR
jgi:HYDIN/CFA65/VesB family protein